MCGDLTSWDLHEVIEVVLLRIWAAAPELRRVMEDSVGTVMPASLLMILCDDVVLVATKVDTACLPISTLRDIPV